MANVSSDTGGVKAMEIGGRMVRERERAIGMTQEERAWRAKYLKDFQLSEGPRLVPALEKELTNPIKRFYRFPLDTLCNVLTKPLGFQRAYSIRFWTGKILMSTFAIYAIHYYFKYNQNDWTRKGGWRVIKSRNVCNPGDPGFPKLSERVKPSDHADRGFKNSTI